MSESDVERWSEDLDTFTKATELMKIDDDASIWDTLMKKIILAKVLGKDAYNLKAIDDLYLKALYQAIDTIEMDANFYKDLPAGMPEGEIKAFIGIISARENLHAHNWLNSYVMMLISLVVNKLAEKTEISMQGE